MLKTISVLAAGLLSAGLTINPARAAETKPLRALLITGGCCHDYAKQKDILKQGLEARANVTVDQIHSDSKTTKPPLPIYGQADYAKGYDVVIHDECSADINDPSVVKDVLAPHRAGTPGVNLHCAMHSYRVGSPSEAATTGSERAQWFDYLGLQSSAHGPQQPIAISFTGKDHALTKGLGDWTTVNEELYNNIRICATATPLARGKQTIKDKVAAIKVDDNVVAWINDYKGTRVFSTTLGHNNATVEDARYLELVTRGLLWACGKLDDSGNPKAGYGPKK